MPRRRASHRRYALDGGAGWLFEDENYSDFVARVQAMDDFATFFRIMLDAAQKGRTRHK